jgi:dihydroflavonol-4-reductase
MKVLVTGPDGVLGSNLVRELLSRDYDVIAMSENGKKSPTIDNLAITKIGGNLLNSEEVDAAVEKTDYVIHCAASTAMWPSRSELVNKVNIDGTKTIIDACLKYKVKRLIYIGTANSFGSGTKLKPGTEKNAYEGKKYGLDYMDSKYKAQVLVQKAVREEGLDAIVINPTFMIGPYDSKPSSGQIILSIYNKKVPGYSLGGKNFVAAKDVAFAVANALTQGRKGECYIVSNENLTYKEAFDKIASTIGGKIVSRKFSSFTTKIFGRINSFFAKIFGYYPQVTTELAILASEEHYYSGEKARRELGLPQTPIEMAIDECFKWFKNNGYLN